MEPSQTPPSMPSVAYPSASPVSQPETDQVPSIESKARRVSPAPRRVFSCPIRETETSKRAENDIAPNYSCTGMAARSMAEVRRHILRAHRVKFLRLCPTCNEHFIDEDEFNTKHGHKGQRCGTVKGQARGIPLAKQWEKVKDLVPLMQFSKSRVLEVYFRSELIVTESPKTRKSSNAKIPAARQRKSKQRENRRTRSRSRSLNRVTDNGCPNVVGIRTVHSSSG